MAKFKYKFERLLNIKEIEEKKEYSELVRIREAIKIKIGEKEEVNKKVIELENNIEKLEVFSVDQMKYYNSRFVELDNEIEKIQKNIEKLQDNEEVQNEKVIEISKKKKILEKLKEKHRLAFNKEEERKLNKVLDELGTRGFIRKGRGSL